MFFLLYRFGTLPKEMGARIDILGSRRWNAGVKWEKWTFKLKKLRRTAISSWRPWRRFSIAFRFAPASNAGTCSDTSSSIAYARTTKLSRRGSSVVRSLGGVLITTPQMHRWVGPGRETYSRGWRFATT